MACDTKLLIPWFKINFTHSVLASVILNICNKNQSLGAKSVIFVAHELSKGDQPNARANYSGFLKA